MTVSRHAFATFLCIVLLGAAHALAKAVSHPAGPSDTVSLAGGCQFRIGDLQSGRLDIGGDQGRRQAVVYLQKDWAAVAPVLLSCNPRKPEIIDVSLGARRVGGRWIPVDGRDKACDRTRFPRSLRKTVNQDAPCFYPQENFKTFSLKGKNWEGVGMFLDMTTGDPKFRQRSLSYCLLPQAVAEAAVCGHVYVRDLRNSRSDISSAVLKVLTSIEFVNGAQTTPEPSTR
ncbi:hypothetical protein [Variovorax sp. PAMC 28711]|uniref:hypothetical protein n=1 Tax=Variovorax sp. PAMC 28711 TaxID=1795631 RepID=UPI000ABCECD1|nr:hypothetical protein [Variovorax sp. PAMC 28711]